MVAGPKAGYHGIVVVGSGPNFDPPPRAPHPPGSLGSSGQCMQVGPSNLSPHPPIQFQIVRQAGRGAGSSFAISAQVVLLLLSKYYKNNYELSGSPGPTHGQSTKPGPTPIVRHGRSNGAGFDLRACVGHWLRAPPLGNTHWRGLGGPRLESQKSTVLKFRKKYLNFKNLCY